MQQLSTHPISCSSSSSSFFSYYCSSIIGFLRIIRKLNEKKGKFVCTVLQHERTTKLRRNCYKLLFFFLPVNDIGLVSEAKIRNQNRIELLKKILIYKFINRKFIFVFSHLRFGVFEKTSFVPRIRRTRENDRNWERERDRIDKDIIKKWSKEGGVIGCGTHQKRPAVAHETTKL